MVSAKPLHRVWWGRLTVESNILDEIDDTHEET